MPTPPPADLPHPRIPVEEARARVVGAVRRVPAERVALAELAGRVLAEPVVAPHDLPRHANSAMDGYAVRAGDPGPWPVADRILAGDDPAPLPAGACAASSKVTISQAERRASNARSRRLFNAWPLR